MTYFHFLGEWYHCNFALVNAQIFSAVLIANEVNYLFESYRNFLLNMKESIMGK